MVSAKSQEECNHEHGIKGNCLNCYTSLYREVSKMEYDNMCPIVEKEIEVRDHAPWFNADTLRAKREKRKRERRWRRLRSDGARREYQDAKNRHNVIVRCRKREYFQQKTTDAGSDIGKLYVVLDGLTGGKKKSKLPEGFSDPDLADKFLEVFYNKIIKR